MTYKLLVLELIEREAVACASLVVVLLQISYNARSNHKLDVAGRKRLLVVLILGLEINLYLIALRNNIAAKIEVYGSNERSRNHVGAQQSLKTNTRCKHGYNLGIARKLRRKEDYGNKYKQRREQIGKVRNKVGVVVENNSLERRSIGRELVKILVYIEHNRD